MEDYLHYLGKYAVIYVTYRHFNGTYIGDVQLHGRIIRAGVKEIVIDRSDGQGQLSLPPRLEEAEPGEYRLPYCEEVVINPDYIGRWVYTLPGPDETPPWERRTS
jgi:hypothetical protein